MLDAAHLNGLDNTHDPTCLGHMGCACTAGAAGEMQIRELVCLHAVILPAKAVKITNEKKTKCTEALVDAHGHALTLSRGVRARTHTHTRTGRCTG